MSWLKSLLGFGDDAAPAAAAADSSTGSVFRFKTGDKIILISGTDDSAFAEGSLGTIVGINPGGGETSWKVRFDSGKEAIVPERKLDPNTPDAAVQRAVTDAAHDVSVAAAKQAALQELPPAQRADAALQKPPPAPPPTPPADGFGPGAKVIVNSDRLYGVRRGAKGVIKGPAGGGGPTVWKVEFFSNEVPTVVEVPETSLNIDPAPKFAEQAAKQAAIERAAQEYLAKQAAIERAAAQRDADARARADQAAAEQAAIERDVAQRDAAARAAARRTPGAAGAAKPKFIIGDRVRVTKLTLGVNAGVEATIVGFFPPIDYENFWVIKYDVNRKIIAENDLEFISAAPDPASAPASAPAPAPASAPQQQFISYMLIPPPRPGMVDLVHAFFQSKGTLLPKELASEPSFWDGLRQIETNTREQITIGTVKETMSLLGNMLYQNGKKAEGNFILATIGQQPRSDQLPLGPGDWQFEAWRGWAERRHAEMEARAALQNKWAAEMIANEIEQSRRNNVLFPGDRELRPFEDRDPHYYFNGVPHVSDVPGYKPSQAHPGFEVPPPQGEKPVKPVEPVECTVFDEILNSYIIEYCLVCFNDFILIRGEKLPYCQHFLHGSCRERLLRNNRWAHCPLCHASILVEDGIIDPSKKVSLTIALDKGIIKNPYMLADEKQKLLEVLALSLKQVLSPDQKTVLIPKLKFILRPEAWDRSPDPVLNTIEIQPFMPLRGGNRNKTQNNKSSKRKRTRRNKKVKK